METPANPACPIRPIRPRWQLSQHRLGVRYRLSCPTLLESLLVLALVTGLQHPISHQHASAAVTSAHTSTAGLEPIVQTARDPKSLPETAATFMKRARWWHRRVISMKSSEHIGAGDTIPVDAPLQGILSLSHLATLPVSRLCPTGECCYSNSKSIVVDAGSIIKISGLASAREIAAGKEERTHSNCIIFGHGNTQLIHVAAAGSLELEMVTLSHGRAAFGAAAHIDGVLISRQSIFAWNTASHAGAALYVARPYGRFRGFDTRFIGNIAHDEEGDIHVDKGAKIECYSCHYQKRERVSDVHLQHGEIQHSGLSFRSFEDGRIEPGQTRSEL